MKTVSILAGLLPLALAINQPKSKCSNFLTIKAPQKQERSRYRRAQQGWFDFGDGSGDSTTDSPVSSAQVTTTMQATTTSKATTTVQESAATTTVQPAATTTIQTDAPTPEPTTEPSVTTPAVDTMSPTTGSAGSSDGKAIIVMLDATGSMQNIGGKGKGRNLVINKMEQFRRMINKKVQNDRVNDQPLTFITFNEKATWTSYNSINDWPIISKSNYNPGYQTNLYDSLGCVLSEYKSRHPDQEVSLYLISDGVHQMGRNKQHLVSYREGEIKGMVEELRDDGWNFNFYGATTQAKKDELKDQANGLGFRAAETLVFDFDGRQFGALLKSMLKQIVGNDQEEKSVPNCKPCPKGRAGKMCRKRRANKIALGMCIKA